MNSSHIRRAFSLTELLIVVAIILILVSLIFVIGERMYAHGLEAQCQSRLEKIGQAIQMYRNRYNGLAPRAWNPYTGRLWYQTLLADRVIESNEILACPVVGNPPGGMGTGGPTMAERENVSLILRCLRYLAHHQETTGRWEAGYSTHHDGVSGLCLLAFFGFGCTDKHPPEFAGTVRRGVEYLSGPAQSSDGSYSGHALMYSQGISLMAMCAAARMCQDPALAARARASAQKSVNYITSVMADHGAFGYNGPATYNASKDCVLGDTNGTSWVYNGLGAAMQLGLDVPESCLGPWEFCAEHIKNPEGYCSYKFDSEGYPGWWLQDRNTQVGLSARVAMRLGLGQPMSRSDIQDQVNFLARESNGMPHHIRLLIYGDHYDPGNGKDFYRHWHTTKAFRQIGGFRWTEWEENYPSYIIKHAVNGGVSEHGELMSYFPADCCTNSTQTGGGGGSYGNGPRYSTAMGLQMLEFAFDDHWLDPEWADPAGEKNSYGYNNLLGRNRATIAANTIVVMDYDDWDIDHDEIDVDNNDTLDSVATRHSDRANALMGDGSVRSLYLEDIQEGMWTPEPGD